MPRELYSPITVPVWLAKWSFHAARKMGGPPGGNASFLMEVGLAFIRREGFRGGSPPLRNHGRLVTRKWRLSPPHHGQGRSGRSGLGDVPARNDLVRCRPRLPPAARHRLRRHHRRHGGVAPCLDGQFSAARLESQGPINPLADVGQDPFHGGTGLGPVAASDVYRRCIPVVVNGATSEGPRKLLALVS